ncbi:MAG: ABC transporter ATP-binding protein [Tenericutes bacterium]|jgi:iron(III) transport system ATP-binding protein|nr:ABC transporter ATP-binding protein [Mycoplasmatota bacterium]
MYIDINKIDFEYDKNNLVLCNCTTGIEQGEIVAILGKSGSGKSTLLRVLSGLEVPKNGEIKIDGEILVSNHHFVEPNKRKIGMVFQDYALFPHLNILQNIQYGLMKKTKEEKEKISLEMLELISLNEKYTKYPHELSGGQQQRVALARALAPNPKMLLLDEPFSNLDKDLRKQIRQDLKRIMNQQNMSCIFATHDYEDAKDIANRILYLEDGKIIKIEIND